VLHNIFYNKLVVFLNIKKKKLKKYFYFLNIIFNIKKYKNKVILNKKIKFL
jgi:hypothetical protein